MKYVFIWFCCHQSPVIAYNPFLTKTDILRQRTKDDEVKKYCVSLLEKFGSFDYTKKRLRELHDAAVQEVTKLGGNPLMEKVVEDFFKTAF